MWGAGRGLLQSLALADVNISIWGRRGHRLSSSSPWFFGNFFVLPGGNQFGRPEKITKDHVGLEQGVWEETEARPGHREVSGKERTRRHQAAQGLPAPSESRFPGPWLQQAPALMGCQTLSH